MVHCTDKSNPRSSSMNRFLALLALIAAHAGAEDIFMAGADLSHVRFFEERGIVYREQGQVRDAFEILKRAGLNCARLRLFTSSEAQAQTNPYNAINNLDYTLPLALRAKAAGLSVLLDFHYSDSWADPGHQAKPVTWTNLTFTQLETQLRNYSSNCIARFKAAGVMPQYVQIGNEITSGMLWPDGRVGGQYETPAQWAQLGKLLKAAIAGVTDAAGAERPKIMIHIDRGGDWSATQWFFDNLRTQQVEFDIIGQSYYPFWHGTFEALRTCLINAANRYQKPVVVVETAFPWTNSASVLGIPATPEGQTRFVAELARIVKGLPGGKGAGIVWWGTEYQAVTGVATAGFQWRSFFAADGEILEGARALGQLTVPVVLRGIKTNASMILSWPLSGAGLSLRTSPNLAPPTQWAPVNHQFDGGALGFKGTVEIGDAPAQFFRLQSN